MSELLLDYKHVDFFSLDIEGAELVVLKAVKYYTLRTV